MIFSEATETYRTVDLTMDDSKSDEDEAFPLDLSKNVIVQDLPEPEGSVLIDLTASPNKAVPMETSKI